MVALLAFLGAGLARALVPEELWEERWALAPFAGVALVVVVQDVVGFYLPAGRWAWLVVVLGLVALASGLWRQPRRPRARPHLLWLLPLAALTALALLPTLASGGAPLASLTNHDGFSYAVLHQRLAAHPARVLPSPENLFDRYYLYLVGDYWRLGITNLDLTLCSLLRVSFLQSMGSHLAFFAGLVPVSVHLALRLLRPEFGARPALLAALLSVLSVTPLLLAGEAYYSQLSACALFPLLFAALFRALRQKDRSSLALAALLGAASLACYPEMLALLALPLLVYLLGLAVRDRALAGRALLRGVAVAALACGLVPFSVVRLVRALGRLESIHTGTWPPRPWWRMLAALLGTDPDPGGPGHAGAAALWLTLGAALVAAWLLVVAFRQCRDLRGLLLSLVVSAAVLLGWLWWRSPGNTYVATKAALSAGPLLLTFAALGLAGLLGRRPRRLLLLAPILPLAFWLPVQVRLAARMVDPRVVLDDELVSLARALQRLPSSAALLVEHGGDGTALDGNRQILIDHLATLFFSSDSGRRTYLPRDTRSYLSQIPRPPSDWGGRPLHALQPRAGISVNEGRVLWQGPTLRLRRLEEPAGFVEVRGFLPAELDEEFGDAVLWSAGRSRLGIELPPDTPGCLRLRTWMRSARRPRLVEIDEGTDGAGQVRVGPAWKLVESLPWRGGGARWLELRAAGALEKLAGDDRRLSFAITSPLLQRAACQGATWGEGWYQAEQDEAGEFRWSAGEAELRVFAVDSPGCYRAETEVAAAPGPGGDLTLEGGEPRWRGATAGRPRKCAHEQEALRGSAGGGGGGRVNAPRRRAERSRLLFPNRGRLRHAGWSPPRGGTLRSLAALASPHGHGALTRATDDNLVAVLSRTRSHNRLATPRLVSAHPNHIRAALLRPHHRCTRTAPDPVDRERHNRPYELAISHHDRYRTRRRPGPPPSGRVLAWAARHRQGGKWAPGRRAAPRAEMVATGRRAST
jgi:hypothetical protein